VAIGPVLLIVAVLIGWALFPGSTRYQQQLDSAKSYFAQKDFAKAIDVLQQIPSSSPLYKQAQDLLTAARNADKQKNIDTLLAQATEQHKQNQDDESLETIRKILDLDPTNQTAISARDEIQKASYERKTQAEQDQYVEEARSRAQQLFEAGNLEGARTRIEEVLIVRSGDSAAIKLKRQIVAQLEAVNRMNSERSRLETARAGAEKARAPEFNQARFTQAQRTEEAAHQLETSKQFDQAAKRFADAANMYSASENAARAESSSRAGKAFQLQRGQAEAARTEFEQSRTKAHSADAETKASTRFQAALAQSVDAQSRFDRGDFAGARGQFDAASKGMLQASDDAANVTQAQLITNQRAAMDTARDEMENAKRGFSGTDPQASAEEARARQLAQDGKLADATTAYQRAASFWRDAVSKDAQRKEAAQKAEADRQSIRQSLDRYRTAYQAKDIAGIRAVFPNISTSEEAATRNNFDMARTIQMTLDIGATDIQITGETARVSAQQHFDIRSKQNESVRDGSTIVFNLGKRNGSWLIQSITRN